MASAGDPSRSPFADKRVLITGGSRGLGLALAHELAGRGARLALLARDRARLEAARAELHRRWGCSVDLLTCDLRDPAQIDAAIHAQITAWGGMDLLINNAGIIQLGPAELKPLREYEDAMAVHFWAPLHAVRAVLPSMRRQGNGQIVNVSSVEGKVGLPFMAPYCASKFALTGLSDALRAELASYGISVTTVLPGLIRTGPASGALAPRLLGTPLFSISAERAARQIVRAVQQRRRSLELGWITKVLIRASALAPNATGAITERVGRRLRVAHRH